MNEEIATRIEKLESFKHSLEKKLIVAMTIASGLGITTFIGGGFITSLVHDLKELTEKTVKLDEKLRLWDREVETAISQLDQQEMSINKKLGQKTEEILRRLLDDIRNEIDLREKSIIFTIEEKRNEITKLGVDKIISQLNNGNTNMVVKTLTIKNSAGNVVTHIGVDNGGDPYLRFNSESGEIRYRVYLKNNQPLSEFYNNSGVNVVTVGVFSDDDKGFARIYSSENKKTQLEIRGNSNGGVLNTYSNNGKRIIYLGPDDNTGNGLVNVMGLHGESKNSHTPK